MLSQTVMKIGLRIIEDQRGYVINIQPDHEVKTDLQVI